MRSGERYSICVPGVPAGEERWNRKTTFEDLTERDQGWTLDSIQDKGQREILV